jgi:large subunit ribosomal protein L21
VYAVVECSGKQYKVQVGNVVDVDLQAAAPGETIELDRVLMLGGDEGVVVGQPTVAGAKVVVEVMEDVRGPKLIVFKYKSKVRYRKKAGHRQSYTRIKVTDIQSATA